MTPEFPPTTQDARPPRAAVVDEERFAPAAPGSRPASARPRRLPLIQDPCADLVQLNTRREILDAVGRETLSLVAAEHLELLETSSAIYEVNGDYAFELLSSAWCRLMNRASRALCRTPNSAEAMASGAWHCHESCWNDASRPAIERGEPVDVPCRGGIRLHAVPIRAGDEVVGALNFGYGTPPRDPQALRALAERYTVPVQWLREAAEAYRERSAELIALAKRRLYTSARLIGETVARARAEAQARQEGALSDVLCRLGVAASGEHDAQRLAQLITDEATAAVGADYGAFFFAADDHHGRALALCTLSGAPREAFSASRMPRATPLLFEAMLDGERVIRLDDVREDPRFGLWGPLPTGHLPVVSYLAVPIRGRSAQVLGALLFGHRERARFTDRHERFMTRLAAQAAIALENARLYQALRDSEERAREADRRKDEFLALLGHELRNPLAPIVTALHLLRREGGAGDRERRIIERQVTHMVGLVDDLLDVSRITRGKLTLHRRRLDVSGVVARAVEMASPLIEQRTHALRVCVPEGALHVHGDEQRLAQAVANLVTNAAKYTPPRGHIDISAEREGSEIVIRVSDDGVGIAPDLLPRLFQPFVQGARDPARREGGLGLGLSIVRTMVELHGGRVAARSRSPARGSELEVRLPAADLAAGADEAERAAEAPRAGRTSPLRRVLIVDDNEDAAEMLAALLRSEGYSVAVALDGPSALLEANGFRPDIALLDIGLPVMDGYELARRLSAASSPAPIRLVALTGYGQVTDRARALAAGFLEHLVKPIQPDALLATLERCAAMRPSM